MITLLSVGRVSKLFGNDGGVLVNLYDAFPEDINIEEPLFAKIDSLTVPLFCETFERRGRGSAIIRFADLDTPRRAEELIGVELSMRQREHKKERSSSDDEIYMEDFAGFTAIFIGYDIKGIVEDFIDNDRNPLFVVNVDGKEALIPANDDLIEGFNVKKKEITFSLPEGLLELYF